MPKLWESDVHKAEVNCKPLLDVMSNGTPKLAINVLIIARVQSFDEGGGPSVEFLLANKYIYQ